MKFKHILTTIFFLSINIFIFGQDNANKNQDSSSNDINEVKFPEMAIYPGCERFEGNTEKLTKCFYNKLYEHVNMFLNTEFPKSSI